MFFDLPPQQPTIALSVPALSASVAERAQAALICARANGSTVDRFGIFDAGRNANEKRFFWLDVSAAVPKLLLKDWVAHGSGSDPDRDGKATKFSNIPNSNATSLGLFRIAERYQGKNPGSSYRLDGLTPGFNSNARARAVVMHTSSYVSPGRVGRSWGCPAIRPEVMKELETIGMQHAMLWIDAEGQGLDQVATVSCPAAMAFIAEQRRIDQAFRAERRSLATIERWTNKQINMSIVPSWWRATDTAIADQQTVCEA